MSDQIPAERHLRLAAPIEELLVPFDPAQLTEKVQRRRRRMWSRLVSLVITVLILLGLYFFGGEGMRAAGFLTVFGVALAISVSWFVGYLIAYLLARRQLRRVRSGTAIRIGRPGVQVDGVYAPWAEVVALTMVTSRFGRHPRLELRRSSGGPASVPLDQIEVLPATLDSTARAYSGGRHGVDLVALEN